MSSNYNSLIISDICNLPHIILFLGHGGDFVGYLLGGKLDVVHEGLLGLVSAHGSFI